MDERLTATGRKHGPLETVLYEIDMLRHCAKAVTSRKSAFERSSTRENLFEFNLAIEGFLLHMRILLNFFMGQIEEPGDLGINQPKGWTAREVDQREYSASMKKARDVNEHYGARSPDDGKNVTCCSLISKFLAHCTKFRHEWIRQWDIASMSNDMESIMVDFEQGFARTVEPVNILVSGVVSNTTTVARITVPRPKFEG